MINYIYRRTFFRKGIVPYIVVTKSIINLTLDNIVFSFVLLLLIIFLFILIFIILRLTIRLRVRHIISRLLIIILFIKVRNCRILIRRVIKRGVRISNTI